MCRVLDWLKKFADDRGLSWQQDEFGNLVIRKPGQAGGEAAPTVVVQVRGVWSGDSMYSSSASTGS